MKFPVHTLTSEPAMATIARNAKTLWPFLAGFGFTGYLMTKVALSVTDDDVKASKFANKNATH